jgi:predicted regulator of Ras-like GTPase activity (Roadblock/LC7/MglB family)
MEEKPADNTPARIPFELPPKGTGAPASERVPASSGPPVLSSIPLRSDPPKQSAPVKPARNPYEPVPFDQLKLSMPDSKSISESNSEKGARRRKPPAEDVTADASPATESKSSGPVIALSLRMLLQNLPAFQRQGDPNLVPEDVKVDFPFALLADQLATGRIAVSSQVFLEAIPSEYRYLFHLDQQEAPVMLPLQEVLKNMPEDALQMRADQEKPAAAETIVTPFSMQADADAKLFKKDDKEKAPVVEPVAAQAAPKVEKVVEKVDAKQLLKRATDLPGIDGCAITFADGLNLAGNLPAAIAAEGLCAVAPTLLQRIDKHMVETKLGALDSMTLHGSNSAMTFFMDGNICLSALHSNGSLAAETRAELAKIVKDLSRTYSKPEISNVDH